jgi:hypothetical protein
MLRFRNESYLFELAVWPVLAIAHICSFLVLVAIHSDVIRLRVFDFFILEKALVPIAG